MEVKTTAQCLS